jgi:hypothetical protein
MHAVRGNPHGGPDVDLIYIALMVLLSLSSFALVVLFERLRRRGNGK